MPFIVKIAAFWLAVALIVWLLRRRPVSVLARMAFAWQGPFLLVGEKRSAFYWRKGLFAVGWLLKMVTNLLESKVNQAA